MEALEVAVVLCGDDGRVRRCSPAAEAMLAEGSQVTLSQGRLAASTERDSRALSRAIAAAGSARAGAIPSDPAMVVLRDCNGGNPLLAEVAPIPGRRSDFDFGPSVLVVFRAPRARAEARAAAAAALLFNLSPAEARIAADLVAGRSAGAIAERRGSSVGTVRTQIRALFDKAGVHSQIELIAAINARL